MPEITRRSTLTILGVGALGAIGAAGARSLITADPGRSESAFAADAGPDNPTRAENRLAGSDEWRIGGAFTDAADDLSRRISGFASATSVANGGTIDFHVSTRPARAFTVTIYRLGYYGGLGGRAVAQSPMIPGAEQSEPVTDHPTGKITCGWDASWSLSVPHDWVSGSYLAAFTTDEGHRSYAPFVVREDARVADFLVVLPFTTYQAYNQWPLDGVVGKSLYYGYGKSSSAGPASNDATAKADPHGFPVDYGTRAHTVSFDRPYSGVGLAQRADLDYAFIQWAEANGYDLAYATSNDLHDGRVDTSRYKGLIFPGHDEYWSAAMRARVTKAVGDGCHAAFLAANNVYWHIRFESPAGDESRELTCYKSDPDPTADETGPTTLWRGIPPAGSQSEQQLVGVMFSGIPTETVPLVVATSDHWFWQGTGVRDGDKIPAIVGGEVDGLFHNLPGPAHADQVVLSASPFTALDDGGRARVQHTSLYQTEKGAIVFAAATFNWTLGLSRVDYADERIQRATANLFTRMRQRPA